ncbi:DUF3717 domain-containing protein [Herbaspirillum sp. AP02]|uniref:DUF3717 domain-containing protein n=2 Tax=Herbaspirillum frisingense TaxID=92645 RepID=A0AAI9IEF5_9BURK|nr:MULTISPECIES: DUF3717 domain-containing protein [Herbaspirillum]EOA04676.1 hypothetical protein HFRIS_010993 [Herbaspirillum frisingense GSF30]MBG7622354.1 DUF3717 domain-containing protein [Herbaspirillum sp. AP02]MCI1016414.1 DUF3717 domain-containing protein [Herbaspirillum sp. C7C2]MDR6586608.1 hypothetical protein [Herbaspirillum frisingense]NZD70243.1 DUF3717 domain-containing protein [Herbaspirillum sp. AP21]
MLTLTELEDAINYWRQQRPASGEECALSPEVNALAGLYALMIFHRRHEVDLEQIDAQARQLIEAWLAS